MNYQSFPMITSFSVRKDRRSSGRQNTIRWPLSWHNYGSIDQKNRFLSIVSRQTKSASRRFSMTLEQLSKQAPVSTQHGGDIGFLQLSWSRLTVQTQGMILDASQLAHLIKEDRRAVRVPGHYPDHRHDRRSHRIYSGQLPLHLLASAEISCKRCGKEQQ